MADTEEQTFEVEPNLLSKIYTATACEKTGHCSICPWAFRCHPIVNETGVVLCTLDFKEKMGLHLKIDEVA